MKCPDRDQAVLGTFACCGSHGADLEPKGLWCTRGQKAVHQTIRYGAYCGEYLGGAEEFRETL